MKKETKIPTAEWNYILTILNQKEYFAYENYISERKYRRQLGLSTSLFYQLKKEGRFEAGAYPSTRGSNRVKYHPCFNYKTQRIEFWGLPNLPIEPKHRRNKNGKKAANPQSSPKQESRQGYQEGGSENATQGFAQKAEAKE